MFLCDIKNEHLKGTILGATLEWAELVRSDKRAHKHPKPTVADPSIRVYNVNNYRYLQYMIPNLPSHR